MNILYISDSYLDLSVYMSQVHSICNYQILENKHNVKLLALCSHKDIKKTKPNDAKYNLIKIYRFPKMFIPVINKFRAYTVKSSIKNEIIWADVIHCRGHVGSAFAINLLERFNLQKPIIADIRGAIVDELAGKNNLLSHYYSKAAERIEKKVFNKANYLFFVSDNMQKYYKNKYNYNQRSSVFPTIVNEQFFYKSNSLREEYRQKLKIGNRITYIYIGGVDHWQNLDKIILKFDEINKKNPGKYFFIILTNNINWVKNFCLKNKINTENIHIDHVPYNEVGKYLNASDYGIIIRKNNIINYVASPTKVNEYLACGLKIINDIEQIGKNECFLEKEYKPLKKIIIEQNNIYVLLKEL